MIWWIGKSVWPYLPALARSLPGVSFLLERCLFIDPPNEQLRWWAIDVALRCRSEGGIAVVGDGRGMSMAMSRRLQLAAEAGSGLGLLARPAAERGSISAARTRWLVARRGGWQTAGALSARGEGREQHPRWMVELLRYKNAPASFHTQSQRWLLEMNRHDFTHANPVVVSPDFCDRPEQAEVATPSARSA